MEEDTEECICHHEDEQHGEGGCEEPNCSCPAEMEEEEDLYEV